MHPEGMVGNDADVGQQRILCIILVAPGAIDELRPVLTLLLGGQSQSANVTLS